MDWKKLTLGALLSGSLIMTGCGDDDTITEVDTGPVPDAGTDSTPGVDAGPGDPLPGECADGDCYFVADQLDIADIVGEVGEETVEGFNLDGAVTGPDDDTGCGFEDYSNAAGDTGIDNQFAALAPVLEGLADIDITETIEDAILSGSILIVMHISDAEGENDGTVTAELNLAELMGGGMPTATGRRIDANQSFVLGPDTIAAMGSLSGGTFHASVDLVSIPLDLVEGTPLTLNIRDAQIGFDVAADGTLSNGVIGGSLNVEELVTALAMIPDFASFETIARDTLGDMADLSPSADDPQFCENISIGLTFHAVAAVVAP